MTAGTRAGMALLVAMASVGVTHAAVDHNQEVRLAAAVTVLQEIRATPDRDIPSDLWERASCVAVVPSVKKAAFVVGGEYGKGLISCRTGGRWGSPAFMLLAKGSWGFQIGGETIDLVLLVMNEHGVEKLLQDQVSLGGDVSVAAGPVGRDARAATDAQLKAEILSYSRAQGLFAGVDISGGVLKPDNDDNRALYGRAITGRELLLKNDVPTPKAARAFVAALNKMSTPVSPQTSR